VRGLIWPSAISRRARLTAMCDWPVAHGDRTSGHQVDAAGVAELEEMK
jgi:hypothetical protein